MLRPRPRSRLPIAFILLISFLFRCFSPSICLCSIVSSERERSLAHKKGAQRAGKERKNEAKFSFIEIPYLAFSSSSRLHLCGKKCFRPSWSQIKRREKWDFRCSRNRERWVGMELHNWWFLACAGFAFCIVSRKRARSVGDVDYRVDWISKISLTSSNSCAMPNFFCFRVCRRKRPAALKMGDSLVI